jgi:hypothetical protein
MSGDTKVLVGAVLVSVVIIAGAVFALGKGNASAPNREALGTASMSIDKTEEDLGDMKVSDEKTATFTITNTSDTILRIWGVATSCDCTFANITIGGQKTGEFNMTMHMASNLKNWIGEVPAGEKAMLDVIYKPSIMPVSGPVTRQVNFSTNDPDHATVEVTIAANVL